MISCHLSRLMGERKVKIIDVARDTGISRNHISALYYEKAKRIDFETIDVLCSYFKCDIGDLLELNKDNETE